MQTLFLNQIWQHWYILVVVLTLLGGIGYFGARYFFNDWYDWLLDRRLFEKLQNGYVRVLMGYCKLPVLLSIIALTTYTVLPLSVKKTDNYNQVATIMIISLLTWLAVQAIRAVRDVTISNSFKRHPHNIDARRINTQVSILVRTAIIILVIVGISLVLMTFPPIREIGVSILASAGVVSLMLGFAAQKSLVNIFAGVQIALTQPIKIGDEVVVENEAGVIEEINLTYVVMCTMDQRRLIIPINHFIEKIFQNWTRNSADMLGIVYIEVDYTAPVQKIREALDVILQTTGLWDKKVKSLQVYNTKTSTIELRILVSAANPDDASSLRCYVREKLIEFLQNNHPYCLPKVRMDIKNTDV